MSHVMCHKSWLTCHLSHDFSYLDKFMERVGKGDVINGAYPIYFLELEIHDCESSAMKFRANGSFPCKGDMSHV